MDLTTLAALSVPRTMADLPAAGGNTAWLAGGTWLYSEPQPGLRHLVDITALGWPALEWQADGLRVAATCTFTALEQAAIPGPAAALVAVCCNALLGSFKVRASATVGGNVCLALPAAPMLALFVALDGTACIHTPGGGTRTVPMAAFATGPQRTVLAPGELLRAIDVPHAALHRRSAARQISLTAHGRSAALLAATWDGAGPWALTVTGSTPHPLVLSWPSPPRPAALDAAIAALPASTWHDDVHGAPAWRRHVTRLLAAELLAELSP